MTNFQHQHKSQQRRIAWISTLLGELAALEQGAAINNEKAIERINEILSTLEENAAPYNAAVAAAKRTLLKLQG